jgi:hypothetical protein
LDFGRPEWTDRPSVAFTILPIDFGYFTLYRVPLLAGCDCSRHFGEDQMLGPGRWRLALRCE